MFVKELQELLPLAQAYELRPGVRYLVTLPNTKRMEEASIALIASTLAGKGLDVVLCDGSIKFYELASAVSSQQPTDAVLNANEPLDD